MIHSLLQGLYAASPEDRPVLAFLRRALAGYGISMIGLALGFVLSVLVARVLGPDGRGTYAWIMSLHGMALPFAMVGLDTFVRQRGAGASKEIQSQLLGTGALLVAMAASAVAVVLYAIGWQAEIGHGNPRLMALALAFTPVVAVANVFSLLLMAQGRMLATNLWGLVPRIVTAALLVGLLASGTVSVRLVLLATLIGGPVLLVCLWVSHARSGVWPTVHWGVLLTHKKFMGGAYVATLLTYLLQRQDVLLLGVYSGAAEVGHYSVATTFIDVLLMGPALISMFLLPHLQAMGLGPQRRLFMRRVLLATGGVLVACALAGIVIAHPLVTLLYGMEFEPAVPLLRILLLAFVFFGIMMLLQNVLALAAKGLPLMVGPAVGAALNLVLNLWWLPAHGATGAAWASVVGYAAACIAVYVMCRRTAGITS